MTELACVVDTIPVAPEGVWDLLTDFGNPQRLAPSILACELVGEVRTVRSSRGLTIREEMVTCDRADWRFGYRILDDGDMPFAGVTRYDCTVTLQPVAGGTRVMWRSEGDVDGPLAPVTAFLDTLYRAAIANIAAIAGR